MAQKYQVRSGYVSSIGDVRDIVKEFLGQGYVFDQPPLIFPDTTRRSVEEWNSQASNYEVTQLGYLLIFRDNSE